MLISAYWGIISCDITQITRPDDGYNEQGESNLANAPYTQDGSFQWYKGNLHTHSYWSDGNDFPEMIMDWYKNQGYNFAVLSGHNILPEGEKWMEIPKGSHAESMFNKYLNKYGESWVEYEDQGNQIRVRLKTLEEYRPVIEEPGSFKILNSEEVDYRDGNLLLHMNVMNIQELITPPASGSVVEILQKNVDAVREQSRRLGVPMIPHVNHPNINWSIDAGDLKQLDGLRFFEVYNGHPNAWNSGDASHLSTEEMWDEVNTHYLLNGKPMLYGLAVDDAHWYDISHNNPGRGWIQVRSAELSPNALADAMLQGNFYASTGVRLSDIQFDGETLSIVIDAEAGVQYTTRFMGTLRDNPQQPGVVLAEVEGTTPRYTFTGNELFMRAKIISDKLKENPSEDGEVEVAWVQPIEDENAESDTPTTSTAKIVYDESLASPWINASWNSTVDYNSSGQAYEGSKAVKVTQNKWGGFSVHSGSWGQAQTVDPTKYEAVEFAIYGDDESISISVLLENDNGESFPKVSYGSVPANQWTTVQIPMSKLNPNNQDIHRLDILETSGTTKTYYVDELSLIGSGDISTASPATPAPGSPADGATGVSTNPTLTWSGDTPNYHLQVARDTSFQTIDVDQQGLTSTSYTLSDLSSGTTYYWKVRGIDQNGNTSSWSATWSFTTRQSSSSGSDKNVYTDNLQTPWINASWSASVDYDNDEYVQSGSRAIKVTQDTWGSLSMRSGSWGAGEPVDPAKYEAVEFAVYTNDQGVKVSLLLENDEGESFPIISYGSVPAGQWTVVRIPMSDLNPNSQIIHRLDILEMSGSTKIYYVDAVRFVGKTF